MIRFVIYNNAYTLYFDLEAYFRLTIYFFLIQIRVWFYNRRAKLHKQGFDRKKLYIKRYERDQRDVEQMDKEITLL